jgi:hypothetical protein
MADDLAYNKKNSQFEGVTERTCHDTNLFQEEIEASD